MIKVLSAVALSVLATAAVGQTMTTKQTTMTKSNPAATMVRHTTVTRTSVHRQKTNVPIASVSLARAERIALNARPGRIVSHRIDQERGGPAYSFNIRNHKGRYEVDVSRRNGRIVENRMIARA